MFGIILLTIAFVFQIFYIGYCIIKKSSQPKLKLCFRFVALGIMIVLLVLGIIKFDFRWILLFIILALMSLFSSIEIFRKPKRKNFKIIKTLFFGVLSFIIIFVSIVPIIIFPPYKFAEPKGQYNVTTFETTYYDSKRIETNNDLGKSREVNIAFWYPDADKGSFPLIIFDHGFSGIKYSNESTFIELASKGYVVCSLDHPYQSFFTTNDLGEATVISSDFMNEYSQLSEDIEKNLKLLKGWMDVRIADTNFVIDKILEEEEGLYSLVNKEVIGIFGHSLGGAVAVAIGRIRNDIDAVVNLDGPMPYEITGINDGKYILNSKSYPAPILNIYSEYLFDIGIEDGTDPLYNVNRLVSDTAPLSYEVVIKGAQHMSLTDLVLFSPFLAKLLDGGE